jgi:hypothetical protein
MSEKLVVLCTPFGRYWHWIIEESGGNDVRWKYFSEATSHLWQRYLKRPNLNTLVVKVLSNVPYTRAMNLVAHSRMTVIPLRDSQVPCGHVTLVSGMLLKKPLIATHGVQAR